MRSSPSNEEEVFDILVRAACTLRIEQCAGSAYRALDVFPCTCLQYQPLFFFHILCSYQNVLDDRLRHANLGVVLGAVRLFLHLTEDMPQLQTDVHSRIKSESQSGTYTCTCTCTCIVVS